MAISSRTISMSMRFAPIAAGLTTLEADSLLAARPWGDDCYPYDDTYETEEPVFLSAAWWAGLFGAVPPSASSMKTKTKTKPKNKMNMNMNMNGKMDTACPPQDAKPQQPTAGTAVISANMQPTITTCAIATVNDGRDDDNNNNVNKDTDKDRDSAPEDTASEDIDADTDRSGSLCAVSASVATTGGVDADTHTDTDTDGHATINAAHELRCVEQKLLLVSEDLTKVDHRYDAMRNEIVQAAANLVGALERKRPAKPTPTTALEQRDTTCDLVCTADEQDDCACYVDGDGNVSFCCVDCAIKSTASYDSDSDSDVKCAVDEEDDCACYVDGDDAIAFCSVACAVKNIPDITITASAAECKNLDANGEKCDCVAGDSDAEGQVTGAVEIDPSPQTQTLMQSILGQIQVFVQNMLEQLRMLMPSVLML